ncbi:hypothetical protein DFS34DRAFT_637407 [Phlyctochytrium arcticum]|nr:hypothetical protein DFS34DRAFT_637407 [Phlyctochytrium arcticum]
MTESEEPVSTENVPETTENTSSGVFQPGDHVWARLKGYPWWPSKVEKEEDLPQDVLSLKRPGQVAVFFYGSRDYGWFPEDKLKPYEECKDFRTKNKTPGFLKALRELDDPSIIEKEFAEAAAKYEAKAAKKASTPRRSGSTGEAGSAKKKTKGENGTPSKKRRSSVVDRRKNVASEEPDAEDEESSLSKKRRKGTDAPADSADDEETKSKHTSKNDGDAQYQEKLSKKLWKIRSRLQGFMKEIKAGMEVTEGQLEDASKWISELEDLDVSVELLMETKIGKVVRHMARVPLEGKDTHNLIERSNALFAKYRAMIPEDAATSEHQASEALPADSTGDTVTAATAKKEEVEAPESHGDEDATAKTSAAQDTQATSDSDSVEKTDPKKTVDSPAKENDEDANGVVAHQDEAADKDEAPDTAEEKPVPMEQD